MKITIFVMIIICMAISAVSTQNYTDTMAIHQKLLGDFMGTIKKNIDDGTLPGDISMENAETLCDEFAAYVVKWVIV